MHKVPGECPRLIRGMSMERLGAGLRLRQEKIDIEDLGVQGETLEFHPRSGHPIAQLLPTVKNTVVGAAPDEHFVGAAAAKLERRTLRASTRVTGRTWARHISST